MAICCDLEVDVNGEEIFMADKKIISSYSGRLRGLFGKSTDATRNLKVIFNDFPGGSESFELISKFCYNNGRTEITPFNICLLHCAAQFMEMDSSISGNQNLVEQIEKSLQDINYWRWSELLISIKQCQTLLPLPTSSTVLEKCMDSLTGRIALISESSPCTSTSSSDSSGLRFSFGTRSTESFKSSWSRVTWWFEDLAFLSTDMIEMLVKSMVSKKFDHVVISKFLFYYQKSNSYLATCDQKCKIAETVVNMLYTLEWSSVPWKSLFAILRFSLNLSIGKCSREKLHHMIGSQMDQANLDNLLIPSPNGVNYLYDVNIVLRFVRTFVHQGNGGVSLERLRKVAGLMDLYLAEVAPDPCLKLSKFLALAMALPDSARDSYDNIYRAIDMYLEVHAGLSEEERMKLCCLLSYEKLSADACIHLSQNKKFPPKSAIQALISQVVKLKGLLHGADSKSSYGDSPCSLSENEHKAKKHEPNKQMVHYTGRLDHSRDNEKLRAHLQGMQCRVMELEKVCRKMQTQMKKIMKSRVSSHGIPRSLPRLCS